MRVKIHFITYIHIYNKISPKLAKKLVESLQRRLQAVIKLREIPTKYQMNEKPIYCYIFPNLNNYEGCINTNFDDCIYIHILYKI